MLRMHPQLALQLADIGTVRDEGHFRSAFDVRRSGLRVDADHPAGVTRVRATVARMISVGYPVTRVSRTPRRTAVATHVVTGVTAHVVTSVSSCGVVR